MEGQQEQVKKSNWTVGKLRNFLKKYNQDAEIWLDNKSLTDVFHLTKNPKETEAIQLSSIDESEVLGHVLREKRGEEPNTDDVQSEDIPSDQPSEILNQHGQNEGGGEESNVGVESSDDEKTDPAL